MNPGTAIYNLLKDSSSVGALVGDKVYPGIIPREVNYPAIRYSELEQRFLRTQDGPVPTGVHNFDVDIYSLEYDKAQEIASAIKGVLSWYEGTVNTVIIERIEFIDQGQPETIFDNDKDLFHITQMYSIRAR